MNSKIPLWVNVMQVVLTLIMLQQVYLFYVDHEAVAASGIAVTGNPNLNLLYEFAGRTATMVVASLFVLITQNARYFIVVLLMNIAREGQETVIDPLFPLVNAPASPMGDFVIHVVIVAIEILALVVVWRIVRSMDKSAGQVTS